jgi:hypothetical protein
VPITSSYSFLVGPLMAGLALGVILLLCRWVCSTRRRAARAAAAAERARSRGDFGLLVPIATVRTGADGEMLRAVLRDAGIRCTVTHAVPEQEWTVLVFRADALRARDLVSS